VPHKRHPGAKTYQVKILINSFINVPSTVNITLIITKIAKLAPLKRHPRRHKNIIFCYNNLIIKSAKFGTNRFIRNRDIKIGAT
jgi:hypothetical protein